MFIMHRDTKTYVVCEYFILSFKCVNIETLLDMNQNELN